MSQSDAVLSTTQASNGGQVKTPFCAARDLPYPRPEPAYNGKRALDFSPFLPALHAKGADALTALDAKLLGAQITDLQTLLSSGQVTSVDLVLYYLNRIRRYDAGLLNSYLQLNPDTLTIAAALDAERAAGTLRSPLHGIPVNIKANIGTADAMDTTAGAAALAGWTPAENAHLVKQLRDAGAIILGKTNMSEWANYMDPCMPSGFSVLGGQTRNPYGAFETWGSSSGATVSVAADLIPVSIGTETQGSIIMPARINSVVGLKPSLGIVSRTGIIPLLPPQDTAGPFGRTVADVALLLDAIAAADAADPESAAAASVTGTRYADALLEGAANGLRVGIVLWDDESVRYFMATQQIPATTSIAEVRRQHTDSRDAAMRAVQEALANTGVTVVALAQSQLPDAPMIDTRAALASDFEIALNDFLAAHNVPLPNLASIIAFNSEDPANRAPYGYGHLTTAHNSAKSRDEVVAGADQRRAQSRAYLDAIFTQFELDAIVMPSDQNYAIAGYPALVVPAGYDESGTPIGTVFVGPYLGDAALLAIGHVYEQATRASTSPNLEATIKLINAE